MVPLSKKARRARVVVIIAIAAILVAFVPARWSLRAALALALAVLGVAWLILTIGALALDFYWPSRADTKASLPKGGAIRNNPLPAEQRALDFAWGARRFFRVK
jgi:hypothetical protein